MPAKGTTAIKREERIDLCRIMIFDKAWPRWKVIKAIRQQYGVSVRTIRRDLEELGKRYRASLDNENWGEMQVAASVQRLRDIAVKAFEAKDWKAAINAEKELLRVAGARMNRWERLIDPKAERVNVSVEVTSGPAQRVAVRAAEYSELTDEDLKARALELRERFQVLDGGQHGVAPAGAAGGRTG